jgi:hypothetical protein
MKSRVMRVGVRVLDPVDSGRSVQREFACVIRAAPCGLIAGTSAGVPNLSS